MFACQAPPPVPPHTAVGWDTEIEPVVLLRHIAVSSATSALAGLGPTRIPAIVITTASSAPPARARQFRRTAIPNTPRPHRRCRPVGVPARSGAFHGVPSAAGAADG